MQVHPILGLALRAGVLVGAFALQADAQTSDSPYRPLPVPDGAYATPALVERLADYFEAKTSASPDAVMGFYARPATSHNDATVGWVTSGWDAQHALFAHAMTSFGEGASYSTQAWGDERSAVITMIDTPELFGGEIRAISAADFDAEGHIVRMTDYWDGRSFGAAGVAAARVPAEQFPTSLGEDVVPTQAAAEMQDLVGRLNAALAAGDAAEAAALFDTNATFEDYTLRAKLRGRPAIERYLERALASAPYAQEPTIRHVLGSATGGGYEWSGTGPVGLGITALGVGVDGEIEQLATVYDGLLLSDDELRAAALLTLDIRF